MNEIKLKSIQNLKLKNFETKKSNSLSDAEQPSIVLDAHVQTSVRSQFTRNFQDGDETMKWRVSFFSDPLDGR